MQLPSILAAVVATGALVASAPAIGRGYPAAIITIDNLFVGVNVPPTSTAVSSPLSAANSMSPYAAPSVASSAMASVSPFVPSAPTVNLTRGPGDYPISSSDCIYQCVPKQCQFTVRMRDGPECGGDLERRLKTVCHKDIQRFSCDWKYHEVHFWAPKHSKRPKKKGPDGKLHREPISNCVGEVARGIHPAVAGCHS